jgi:cation diffusion facilitator CzcD-associated flavoprotein CzcO
MLGADESVFDALVIGAGFTGLAVGARLRRAPRLRFAILEQGRAVGAFWRGTYDRVKLHSPDHDLPHDGGLRGRYPMLLARDELLAYFAAYADHHGLGPHLRFGTRVLRVEDVGGERPWQVETDGGVLRARALAVATSVNRVPHRVTLDGAASFGGRVVHGADYRNPAPFRGRSVLVVGSGNSGAEIAVDLLDGGARAVAMWVRAPRHFVPLGPTLALYRAFRALGQMSEKKLAATHALTRGTPAFDREVRLRDAPLRLLSADLSRFGIRKPDEGPFHGIMYLHRHPVMDIGAIDKIRDGSLRVIDGNARPIRGLVPSGVAFSDGDERFDDVILATGYDPGLEALFGASSELLGPQHGRAYWPLTDGRCRSRVRPSVFFPGFDPTPLGGISLGRWGWEVGDRIAEAVATSP